MNENPSTLKDVASTQTQTGPNEPLATQQAIIVGLEPDNAGESQPGALLGTPEADEAAEINRIINGDPSKSKPEGVLYAPGVMLPTKVKPRDGKITYEKKRDGTVLVNGAEVLQEDIVPEKPLVMRAPSGAQRVGQAMFQKGTRIQLAPSAVGSGYIRNRKQRRQAVADAKAEQARQKNQEARQKREALIKERMEALKKSVE